MRSPQVTCTVGRGAPAEICALPRSVTNFFIPAASASSDSKLSEQSTEAKEALDMHQSTEAKEALDMHRSPWWCPRYPGPGLMKLSILKYIIFAWIVQVSPQIFAQEHQECEPLMVFFYGLDLGFGAKAEMEDLKNDVVERFSSEMRIEIDSLLVGWDEVEKARRKID